MQTHPSHGTHILVKVYAGTDHKHKSTFEELSESHVLKVVWSEWLGGDVQQSHIGASGQSPRECSGRQQLCGYQEAERSRTMASRSEGGKGKLVSNALPLPSPQSSDSRKSDARCFSSHICEPYGSGILDFNNNTQILLVSSSYSTLRNSSLL